MSNTSPAQMMVQDQFQLCAFFPDLCSRECAGNLGSVVDCSSFFKAANDCSGAGGPQESGLTCNASASRKRARDDSLAQEQCLSAAALSSSFVYPDLAHNSGGWQMQRRLAASCGTSTSGRAPVAAALAQDLASCLNLETLEIDALIRLQSESIRSGVEAVRKRHCRALLSALDQQVSRRLREKEAELEVLRRWNAALEEKLRQMAVENQIWFNCAKNNEAMVSSLRASLDQALVGSIAAVHGGGDAVAEGYGDSDGAVPAIAADDAGSCFNGEGNRREAGKAGTCKACGERDVCVLLLPCRHLCLCSSCESKFDACPICLSPRNASIQIFLT